ncbi:aspartate/glutamate racemase family protein [Pseudomonadota bacterium]
MESTRLFRPSTVAIIGAMGPDAAMYFYKLLMDISGASKDQGYPSVNILQNTNIPDRTGAILEGGQDPTFEILRSLESARRDGVRMAVMTCNTAHHFIKKVQEGIGDSVRVFDMLQITADFIRDNVKEGSTIGLLATNGTVKAGVYQRYLDGVGVKAYEFSSEHQELVHSSIYGARISDDSNRRTDDGIKAGSQYYEKSAAILADRIEELRSRRIKKIILGCTELPLVRHILEKQFPDVVFIDPMKVLARKVIKIVKEIDKNVASARGSLSVREENEIIDTAIERFLPGYFKKKLKK